MSRMDIISSRSESSEKSDFLRKSKRVKEGKSNFPNTFASRASEEY